MSANCKRLVYWGQYGPTCWFNSLLMTIFYSQLSRELILKASKSWDTRIKIYKIFKHILKYKYIKSKNPEKDIKFFEDIKPEKIIDLLHNFNKKNFMFNIKKKNEGFAPIIYLKKFYKILGLNCMYFIRINKNTIAYNKKNHIIKDTLKYDTESISYKTKKKTKEYIKNKLKTIPDVIAIECNDDSRLKNIYMSSYSHYIIHNDELLTMNDEITFNNVVYKLDSVILTNWNQEINRFHVISGLTCDNEKYVYNGWTRLTKDPSMTESDVKMNIPCELMKYNWNIKKDYDFCLNVKMCQLNKSYPNSKELCFSFNKGERILVYIKKPTYDMNMNIIQTPEYVSYGKSPINCPDGKVLNPKTGRCVKSLLKQSVSISSQKNCPDGKVLNPKTGRCVKSLPKQYVSPSQKNCPDGKVLNPMTGRCIKTLSKSQKKCPDGKIRNPITNRCIALASAKKKNLI